MFQRTALPLFISDSVTRRRHSAGLEKGYKDRAGNDLPYLRVEPLLDPTARRSRVRRTCRKSFCAEECIVAMNLDARTT
jgi:hypothetical protein